VSAEALDTAAATARIDQALAAIAARAEALDREPRFPAEAFAALHTPSVTVQAGASRNGASCA